MKNSAIRLKAPFTECYNTNNIDPRNEMKMLMMLLKIPQAEIREIDDIRRIIGFAD